MEKRLKSLRKTLRSYEKSYKAGKPEVSDSEYDSQLEELEALEANLEDVDSDSPTQSLDDTEGKEEHFTPMLSMQKSKTWKDFLKFDKSIRKAVGEYSECTYVLQPKYDGVAASLIYRNGEFAKAITRGDGYFGEDITEHIKNIKNVPQKIRSIEAGDFTIRGEVVISKENFAQLEGFSNPRNLVAGTLKAHDPTLSAKRKLDFIAHTLGDPRSEPTSYNTLRALDRYNKWGFTVAGTVEVKDLKHLQLLIRSNFELIQALDHDCDGLVIKVNEYSLYHKIKDTAKHHKYVIAIKPEPSSGVSNVKEIIISKGAKGKETPVAIIDPLVLDNVTIQKVNLYNKDNVKKLKIKVGSKVEVIRSNGVIPVIRKVL